MNLPPSYITTEDDMKLIMKKFKDTNAWNLPVIENGKYLGFVSKSKMFEAYRKLLLEISSE
jgi:CIC family chloride channel protein